jgi:alpha/beta hydrolase fold
MRLLKRGCPAAFLIACLVVVLPGSPAQAQDKKEEDVSLPTVDGLRLSGVWYPGSKGKSSDVILFLHNWGESMSKGDWSALAQALHQKGFAVLMFDFRGHGKSTTMRTIDKPEEFLNARKYPFNRYANTNATRPEQLKGLDYKRFTKERYFPYLVNDIAAARRFIDGRNDQGECNAGRIFVIADREMCSLAMLWGGVEFHRKGINPIAPGVAPPNHIAGSDIMGAVWLNYKSNPSVGPLIEKMLRDRELAEKIERPLEDKVSVAFVFSEDDKESANIARIWFTRWSIKPNQNEDRDKGKYMIRVKGAKTLQGVNLLDPKLKADEPILEFITATKKKNLTGNDYVERHPNVIEAMPVDLSRLFGLKQ